MSDNPKLNLPTTILTDDEMLQYTQRIRRGFVDHTLENGFPSDPKEQAILLSAISDMDRTAIQNKRIGTDANQAEADRMAAMMIAKMSNQFNGADPFARGDGSAPVREFPTIDETLLPEVTLVPGETEVGISELTYDELAARMGKKG